MLERNFIYRGNVWSTAFLDTESRLSHDERGDIVLNVIDLYLDKEKTKRISRERYEGRVYKKGYAIFEGHAGPRYVVELDCDFLSGDNGKPSRLDFILVNHKDYTFN